MGIRLITAGLGLFLLTTGCGRDPVAGLQRSGMLPTLVLASPEQLDKGEVLAASYLVAFRNDLPDGGRTLSHYRSEYRRHYLDLSRRFLSHKGIADLHFITALDLAGAGEKDPLTGPAGLRLRPLERLRNPGPAAGSLARVDFTSPAEAARLLRLWEKEGRIWYAEPNYQSRIRAGETSYGDYATTYQSLVDSGGGGSGAWLSQIDLPGAFLSLEASGAEWGTRPLVAVMDSGIDYEHPRLVNSMWVNTEPNQAGCSGDIYGCNTTASVKGSLGDGRVHPAGAAGPSESCGGKGHCMHGTHVAGIIAAEPGEFYGGVCPVCDIMAIKVVGKNKRGEGSESSILDSSIVAGFSYLSRFTKSGKTAVRIVNASFGKFQRSRSVEYLVRLLRHQRGGGTLVVAAAGNENTMRRQYPAAFEDVLSVVNVDGSTGIKEGNTNFGPWTDIAAPGSGSCAGILFDNGLLSTVPGGASECLSGSSMSSPVVAGIAGLLLLQDEGFSFDALRERLLLTSEPGFYSTSENRAYIPGISGQSLPVPLLGQGIVNAANAVGNVRPTGGPDRPVFDRVDAGCGIIGGQQTSPAGILWLLLPLALPLIYFLKRLA